MWIFQRLYISQLDEKEAFSWKSTFIKITDAFQGFKIEYSLWNEKKMEITKRQTNFEGRCPYSAILHYAYSCLIKRALTRLPRGNISSFNPRSLKSYKVERLLWKGEVKLVSEWSKASTSEIPLSGDWWFCKIILRFNAQYRHFKNFMNKIQMLIEKPYLFIGSNFVRFHIKCCIFNFRNLTGKVLSISKVELQVKKQVFIWIIHSNLYFRGERYRFECYLEIYTIDLEISIYIWILTPNLFHATTK